MCSQRNALPLEGQHGVQLSFILIQCEMTSSNSKSSIAKFPFLPVMVYVTGDDCQEAQEKNDSGGIYHGVQQTGCRGVELRSRQILGGKKKGSFQEHFSGHAEIFSRD